jgi:alpha-beta hydrolase superfamily lysophospholipase
MPALSDPPRLLEGPLRLRTADGVDLAAVVHLTDEPARATVVLVHGFTATKDHEEVLAVAGALARAGFDVLAYDGRGHGESGGHCTLGDEERHDVASAVDAAKASGAPVVALGASMGAIAVLRHAAEDPSLAGVVTVSCPARWRIHSRRSALGAVLTRTPVGRFFLRHRAGVRLSGRWNSPPPPANLASLVTSPLAVVHGEKDRFIPPSEALRLHARASRTGAPYERRLDLVAGMGHAFDPVGTTRIVEAVEWALERSGNRSPAPASAASLPARTALGLSGAPL